MFQNSENLHYLAIYPKFNKPIKILYNNYFNNKFIGKLLLLYASQLFIGKYFLHYIVNML